MSVTPIKIDFPTTSKSDWLTKIKTDLKRESLEDLQFELSEGQLISPFFTIEDLDGECYSPLEGATAKWYSGVCFENYSNQSILQFLNQGAQAIRIDIGNKDLKETFKDVNPEFIYSDIICDVSRIEEVVSFFAPYKKAKGCLNLRAQQIGNATYDLPNFQWVSVHQDSTLSIIAGLEDMIHQCIECFDLKIDSDRIRFIMTLDHDIVHNLAMIRALRVLYNNLLDHYKLPLKSPMLTCQTPPELSTLNKNKQLIATSHMAIAAVMSSCDLLYLLPVHEDEEQARLALNIQHLMKYESYINQVADPLAGSYVVEKLATDLAKQVWDSL